MDRNQAFLIAEYLNELSCKGCTEKWLVKHNGITDPIQEIKECGSFGFISKERQDRLVNEVEEINNERKD